MVYTHIVYCNTTEKELGRTRSLEDAEASVAAMAAARPVDLTIYALSPVAYAKTHTIITHIGE